MKSNNQITSRRNLLKATGAAASSSLVGLRPRVSDGSDRSDRQAALAPSEQLNLALIGCGGQESETCPELAEALSNVEGTVERIVNRKS